MRLILLLLIQGLASVAAAAECSLVEDYLLAANSGNVDAFAKRLEVDATVMFFGRKAGDTHLVRGKEAVLDAVRAYKTDCPSCESSFSCLEVTDGAEYALEHVTYVGKGGEKKTQISPLIIEFAGSKLRSIIYYPVLP